MRCYRVEHAGHSRALRLVGVAILVVCVGTLCVGCFGGGDDSNGNAPVTTGPQPTAATTTTTEVVIDENAAYSTFRSKDPFISQAQSEGTTDTSEGGATSTTAPSGSGGNTSTTVFRPTTTTGSGATTTTTQASGSTTTTQPPSTTTTTAPHLHTLKVLSVGMVGGAAGVTLQVDSSVYKDLRVGSVVSTSWGQIKVLDINTSSKVVTLLHGSETLNLISGQVVYQ